MEMLVTDINRISLVHLVKPHVLVMLTDEQVMPNMCKMRYLEQS